MSLGNRKKEEEETLVAAIRRSPPLLVADQSVGSTGRCRGQPRRDVAPI
uniref:Uncharacterized protein n=1 Tax=Cucumis melo TaxID=3656 RepID=A0A9I9E8E4_CUCME